MIQLKYTCAIKKFKKEIKKTFSNRNLLFAKLDMMLTEMAKKHKDDINSDEEEAKKALISKLAAANKQLHGTTVSQVLFFGASHSGL